MKEYIDCKCGSKETYISFAGGICCYPCFSPLALEIAEKINLNAIVIADDGGWLVEVNGVVKKYFSKYEDYALTEARAYARLLNNKGEG